jgi:DNA-binding GntR family transcriptional regulator
LNGTKQSDYNGIKFEGEVGSLGDRIRTLEQDRENRHTLPEMSAAPIETRTLSDQVYQFLADRILEGGIGYGDRLNIREIADLLHVSTMPVREALKRLSLENVVTIKPRSTSVVKIPTRRSMLEAFETREMIELHAVNRIYSTASRMNLENLQSYLDQMMSDPPVSNEDLRMRGYAKYDQLFHQELVALTENSNLLHMYRTTMLHLNIALTFRAGVEPDMTQVSADHQAIVRHLRGNSPEAAAVLKRHLEQCRTNMTRGALFNSLE